MGMVSLTRSAQTGRKQDARSAILCSRRTKDTRRRLRRERRHDRVRLRPADLRESNLRKRSEDGWRVACGAAAAPVLVLILCRRLAFSAMIFGTFVEGHLVSSPRIVVIEG